MAGETIDAAIRSALGRLYTHAEALEWLQSPHPHLAGRRPLDLMVEGKGDDVLAVLRRIEEDAYL